MVVKECMGVAAKPVSRFCTQCGAATRRVCQLCGDCAANGAAIVPTRNADLPTYAAPGSEEKIRVLADRYAAGCYLWHPLDRTAFDRRR